MKMKNNRLSLYFGRRDEDIINALEEFNIDEKYAVDFIKDIIRKGLEIEKTDFSYMVKKEVATTLEKDVEKKVKEGNEQEVVNNEVDDEDIDFDAIELVDVEVDEDELTKNLKNL